MSFGEPTDPRSGEIVNNLIQVTVCFITFLCSLAINYHFVRRVGQKYFVSNKERGSFSRAVEFCSQQHIELALPQNEEENNALTQVFEGNFEVDMKNQRLTFTKWGEGQPDKSIQDTGCTMLSENGIWQVTPECSVGFHFYFLIFTFY
uniref:C-type lectin domain-containing protein n=1 Tax=Pundamilia nyererei TaxID=303518 RepID=A0A3B4EYP6_9CICH